MHPLWRTDHNNNCGIGAPEIEYTFHPEGDWVELTTVHKGGLFGSDYRMLFPGDGIDGIRRFYLDTLIGFGKRGLAQVRRHRKRRSVCLRHPGHAGELRCGQGGSPGHVR